MANVCVCVCVCVCVLCVCVSSAMVNPNVVHTCRAVSVAHSNRHGTAGWCHVDSVTPTYCASLVSGSILQKYIVYTLLGLSLNIMMAELCSLYYYLKNPASFYGLRKNNRYEVIIAPLD